MKTAYGYPIVTTRNIHLILKKLGIKPWEKTAPDTTLEEYAKRDLNDKQRAELRFAPKPDVVRFYKNPATEEPFTGFCNVGDPWLTVFALVPWDPEPLVVVTVEFKHGFGKVVLVPPSGNISQKDRGSWPRAAKREFEEETGFKLARIIALASGKEQGASVRQYTAGIYSFLGILKDPVERRPSRLDDNELLKVVLVPLSDWLDIIDRGDTYDIAAVVPTHLGVRKLQKLRML
ncbi:hypothetical protein EPN28_01700 [Patescibacteria group bacterium]|nr:MAG: hypothetical protein EPN28_01700 [Patescibacteria group bacterium]